MPLKTIPVFANKLSEKIKASMEKKLDSNDLERLIDKFKVHLKPSEAIVQKLENENAIQKTENMWDFLNSITKISQGNNIDIQERMEEYAGKVLMAV